jgi:hypothetical protein
MRRIAFPLLRAGGVAFGLMIAAAGCSRTPPEDRAIAADDTTTFFRWKRDTASQLSPAQQQQLDTTVEEIRLDVMLRHEASGHDAIEAAVCARLNHLTVKQALLLGGNLRWQRLAAERDDLQRVANANAHLLTKPGDEAAAADLAQYRAKFQQRIDKLSEQLHAAEREIVALGGPIPKLHLPTAATQPIAVSRAEAVKQIADMLEGRRGAAMVRFGEWPVKIDWEGSQLTGEKRDEFLAKRSVNGGGASVVIPIRIKRTWLLFEGPNQAPGLPDDVRAQLTAEELAKFKQDWIELEAELWARRVAADIPDPATKEDAEPDLAPPPITKPND